MDIEIFNYIDILMHDYRAGRLKSMIIREEGLKDSNENILNAGVVYLPMKSAPNGMIFKRNNSDFINNFCINIIASSFTDIEDFLKLQE